MEIIEDAAGITLREIIPRRIPVASPVAGADWSFPVPGGAIWYPLSVVATIVTSAVVANRNIALTYSDESGAYVRIVTSATVPASTTSRQSWARGLGANGQGTTLSQQSQSLPSFPLLTGDSIGVSTIGIDAADAWSAIRIYVAEVEERPYDVELDADLAQLRGMLSNAVPSFSLGV